MGVKKGTVSALGACEIISGGCTFSDSSCNSITSLAAIGRCAAYRRVLHSCVNGNSFRGTTTGTGLIRGSSPSRRPATARRRAIRATPANRPTAINAASMGPASTANNTTASSDAPSRPNGGNNIRAKIATATIVVLIMVSNKILFTLTRHGGEVWRASDRLYGSCRLPVRGFMGVVWGDGG